MNHWITQSLVDRRRAGAKLFVGLAMLGLLFASAGAALKVEKDSEASAGIQNLQQTSKAFAHVAKEISPGVVFIKVEKLAPAPAQALRGKEMPMPFHDDWLKEFFGDRLPDHNFQFPQTPRGDHRSIGQGSGFIISADGYVLTNNHVVSDADKVTVTLADGREFDGKVIGADSHSDVAVVKIEASGLPALNLGDSDAVEVGEWVLAIGSPFGLSGTVTSGIVSAKGRNSVGITDFEDFLQTDAAINPGNSGGPLVNLQGDVIGINTAIFSRSGANNGIGFAIPINMARQISDQLIAEGAVTRGYLGIVMQELTPELAESFALDSADGLLISDVKKDSPAFAAGLEAGDVIVEFDGKSVKNMGKFRNMVAATSPDSAMEMVVIRNGERKTLTVNVGRLAGDTGEASTADASADHLGLKVMPLNDELREKHGWSDLSGVVVSHVEPNSPAALAGVQPGMLIQEINRHSVSDANEFKSLMNDAKEKGAVLLRVRQGDVSRYVSLTWKN